MRRRVAFLGLLCVLVLPRAATPTVVVPPSLDELVARARTIFVGEVIGQRVLWEAAPDGRSIVTLVHFKVDDVWKGRASPITELEFLGGTIGDVSLEVTAMPVFVTGQRDVLFVADGSLHAISPLVGFMFGRLRIERDSITGVDRVRAHDGRSIASTSEIGRPRSTALATVTSMRLVDLATAVRSRVALEARP